jgi:hypothetical protein
MKKSLFLFLLGTACASLFAQGNTERPRNAIQAGLLADGSYYSASYERLMHFSARKIVVAKIGIGRSEREQLLSSGLGTYLTIPHQLSLNLGSGRSLFEFGIGATAYRLKGDNRYITYPLAGYRFLPKKSPGLAFKITAHVPFNIPIEQLFFSPIGISAGLAF